MRIVAAVAITATITALVSLVVAMRRALMERKATIRELKRENRRLNDVLDDCRDFEIKRREQDAYQRGLYDGRETDAIYRGILRRQQDGERITVKMEGGRKNG